MLLFKQETLTFPYVYYLLDDISILSNHQYGKCNNDSYYFLIVFFIMISFNRFIYYTYGRFYYLIIFFTFFQYYTNLIVT